MLRTMCRGKIHRATVTDANLHYVGSITIDPVLLEAADILPYERVQVVNVNNGERFETYVIEGERGKGEVVINGAAARLAQPGDIVIIMSYVLMTDEEAKSHSPKVVLVDERNRPVSP
ncbi:MAG: aspartate 1-decarboxylase [Firmicutes bacterium]|jgi:aspartate 1-decarboxylase|nr:aspartate 1-decarboxylase [Bacillota bacterium]